MLREKAAQMVLFAWMVLLCLLTMRMLLTTKSGVLLVGLVIAGFSAWMAFRLVERFVAAAWKISGAVAAQLLQKTVAARVAEDQCRGE